MLSFGEARKKAGIFVYDLPLLRHWHSYNELKPMPGKTYQYFGYNWWDLMNSNIFQQSKYCGYGTIELKTSGNSPGYIFINCSSKPIRITNKSTKEVYLINGYSTRLYNKSDENILVADYSDCLMQYTRLGDATGILLGLEQLLIGKSDISKSPLYKDLLLGSGVLNADQYYATTGLNAYLSKVYREHGHMESEEDSSMMHWVETLAERWKNINPAKRLPRGKSIPHKIHWIWLSRVPGTPNPLRKKYTKFMKSWIMRNPTSEFFLWTDSSDPKISPEIRDRIQIMDANDINDLMNSLPSESKQGILHMYKKHPNVGSRADTLRQCILYSIGGIYADVNDMLCMIPLETYMDKFDFMAGLEPMLYVNNAFVASAPKHPIVRNFLQFIAQNSKEFVNNWDPNLEKDEKDNLVVSQTGPIAFSSIIFGLIDPETGQDLPRTCIFPSKFIYSNYEINETPLSWLTPITLCSHWDERAFLK
jgi:mannosyltransferase OCH1-like enzyme